MTDRSIKKWVGSLYDVFVRGNKFIFPTNCLILEFKLYMEIQIILGRLILAIDISLVDIEC